MSQRRAACLLLGVLGLVLGPVATAPAAAAGDYPRVLQVETDRPPQVSLDVVVPPLLASQLLPASAFQITDSGRRLPVTATRLTPSPLRVVLVLDTAVSPAVLAAQQGAAREFLFKLPARAEVGVVAGRADPVVLAPPTADRSATVRALVALEAEPPDQAVDVTPSLGTALDELELRGGANVVIVVDSRPDIETVPYDVSRTALDARTAVYALLLKRGPAGYLGGLPALSGGRVLQLDGPRMLLNAFDTVQSDLLGRYRVGYLASGSPGREAQLVVAAAGVQAATTFAVGETARPTSNDEPPPLTTFAAVLLAILLCAVLVGRLATPAATRS